MNTKIVKSANFAADIIPGGASREYQYKSPGRLLADLYNVDHGNLDFSSEQLKDVVRIMPATMVGVSYSNAQGEARVQEFKTADFLGAGSNGSSVAGSGIVPILVADTVMAGAMKYTCMRDLVKTIRMKTETETVPFFTARTYADVKAPGAQMKDLAEDIGKALLRTKTYSVMAGLDKGLIKDASGDIVSSVLEEMGGTMELTLDRKVLSTVLDAASGTVTAATTADALSSLGLARGTVGNAGYIADSAAVNPLYMAYAANKMFVPAYNEIAQQAANGNGLIVNWLGMKIGQSGVAPNGTNTAWAWGTTNDIGAVVFDATKIGMLGIREDMEFAEFDNVTKYLNDETLTSRFDFVAAVDSDKPKRNNKAAACLVKLA